ncbi:MAG: DUF4177 domain-containing protein [Herpetosiphonaceae bacterium]|nr:DUF4177 domain-containing protein [Herpetosiphonaceae bacterium]
MSTAGMPTVRLTDPTPRWEYRVASLDVSGFFGPHVQLDDIDTYLNQAGNEGWELVAVTPVTRGEGTTSQLLITLKRIRQA